MKQVILSIFAFVFCLGLNAQEKDVFHRVEETCPNLPVGLLHAISFANTHCHHLTDSDYHFPADDPSSMPRTYGMMGLVKDGKGCFRENLKTVSVLSGYAEQEILDDPFVNVLAYAKACEKVALQKGIVSMAPEAWASVIMELSELPMGEKKDDLPMKMMLYEVYDRLGADLETLFGEDYGVLSGSTVSFSKETDYPGAIWIPAAECNYSDRTKEISAVVIHYTEGSYAGCISWFQNCDAEVSSHYVIRSYDGQVTQMVREKDKAWHVGTANGYTIGIEHEAYGDIISFFTEAMYTSSADLVRNICSRYEPIDGHRTFYRDTLDNGMALNTGVHPQGGEDACVKIRGHQHYPDQTHTDPGPYWDWNYYYKLINEGSPVVELGGPDAMEGELNHEYYDNDERVIWVIRSGEGTSITLEFTSFDLEENYDFLWIYDGDNVYAPKLGRWNTVNPGSVTSSGNALCVEFRSDCLTAAGGWRSHWTVNQAASSEECYEWDQNEYEIVIFDMLGRPVSENQMSRGVYIVRFTNVSDGQTFVKRIIR